jgi:chemotaxis protein histidine kinase CheA
VNSRFICLSLQIFNSVLAEGWTVQPDHFDDRLDAVRKRFASSLESKINDTRAELPSLVDTGAGAIDAVANAYRRIHGICGVGGAVGFAATGRAAKDVEDALIAAYRAQRGLEAAEMARLEKALGALAAAAQAELRTASPSKSNAEG